MTQIVTEDADLIESLLAGDSTAAAAVEDWVRAAARPFRFKLGEDWEDGVQEALIRLLEQLRSGRFEGRSSLKTYVWRLTSYRFTDRLRSRRRRTWIDLEDTPTGFDGLPDESPGPQTLTLRRERFRIASRVFERTPESCRRLWRMLMAGLSYRQMGEEIGVAEGTLRVRSLRCRDRALKVARELGQARGAETTSGG